MNFQQLRILRETVRQNFNLTEVASALFTSQSGVSKHIKDLEDELGVELFVRRGKRILRLTDAGQEMVRIAERMLLDANNIRGLADQFAKGNRGNLSITTTHTQARYALPDIIARFKAAFPKVHLTLHQASPKEIVSMLLAGEADIGIATELLDEVPELASFPFYTWNHAVIVPASHPLTSVARLTLADIATYPIITYHEGFTGRTRIDATFAAAGLAPDIVLSALDADVIKTYVDIGLGIGIIASVAYDPVRDANLRLLKCDHLFQTSTTRVALRKGHFLRDFAYRFIELCDPKLTEQNIKQATVLLHGTEID